MFRRSILLTCSAILAISSSPVFSYSYQTDSTTETIALTNDPAPDSIFSFYAFSESALNNHSELAFYALGYIPDTLIYRDGIWFRDSAGIMSLLAVRFGAVPGHPGLQFDDVQNYFLLNENGQVFYASSLTGAGVDTSNDYALFYRDVDSSISLMVREGEAAPGWPGSPPFDGFFGIQDLNNNAEMLFSGWVNLGPHPQIPEDIIRPGLWKITSLADIELVAKDGDPAPGTGGATFSAFRKAYLNDGGRILFEGRAGPGLPHGVWTKTISGPIEKVAYEGDAAPLLAGAQLGKSGTNSTPLMNAVLNNQNEVALYSIISGAGVTDSNDHAIWFRGIDGSYQLVVREGDSAPGIAGGVTIAEIMGGNNEPTGGRPEFNDAGQVVFTGALTGAGVNASNDQALWLWDTGSSSLLARSGSAVPGLQAGESIASITLDGSKIQLNENGDVLFEAEIAGPSVTTANDQALILVSQTYGTSVFIREGDTMEVAPGDNRVVTDYLLEGNPGVNSSSQLLFTTGFGDVTFGLFLTSPDVAPPPCDVEHEHHHKHHKHHRHHRHHEERHHHHDHGQCEPEDEDEADDDDEEHERQHHHNGGHDD